MHIGIFEGVCTCLYFSRDHPNVPISEVPFRLYGLSQEQRQPAHSAWSKR